MSVFSPIPLGQRIPGSPHSVACSLPTMADVIGYEEGRPETTKHIASGYPRFVVHTHAKRLCEYLGRRPELAGKSLWLVSSPKMAAALADYLGRSGPASAVPFAVEGIDGVAHTDTAALNTRGKVYLQNIGGFLSSRAAEDHLVRLGELPAVAAEKLFPGDATAEIKRVLRGAFPVADTDLLLAPSGMNALYASFRAISTVQARAGRTTWVQLGWLYLDSIALLKKFTPDPARDYLRHGDVADLAGLEKLFATHGPRIAGLIIEAPTNPLIQTADIAADRLEPVHGRDLARLAAQIGATPGVVARINASTLKVAAFLEAHPAVEKVWWALQPATKASYLKGARTPASPGCMISFTLKGPLAKFYDAVRLPKGPSFGMTTTLISPFIYLAHYDLVTSEAGRAELAAHGLSPELLRLCIGTEPVEEIIAALNEALG